MAKVLLHFLFEHIKQKYSSSKTIKMSIKRLKEEQWMHFV